MQVLHEKNHPNGFKIFIASKYSSDPLPLDLQLVNVIRHGAQLQFVEDGLTFKIDPNAAVLKLCKFKEPIPSSLIELLEFETFLTGGIVQYLVSSSPKDLQCLKEKLAELEKKLTCDYVTSNSFSAADIIIFCSLLPLNSDKKSVNVLESFPKISAYLIRINQISAVKEAIVSYFGQSGVSFDGWSPKIANSSFETDTWSLLKGNQRMEPSKILKAANSSPTGESPSEDRKISEKEVENAKKEWSIGGAACKNPLRIHPVLPQEKSSNIFITSAIPYVNNVPHLGNIIGCVLSADCYSRFCRIRGDNVLYICGTDEYGTATETKAIAENTTPQQICDKYHKIHADVYKWFNIDFDYFGRTTTPSQTVAAQAIFWDLYNNGNITQNSLEQLYCAKCDRFLADRFVEGTCPFLGCGYEDARGDQCDGCGKLVNATDLVKPRCKLCSGPPELRHSKHLFLDLPKIEPELKTWVNESSAQWTANAKVICDSWIRDGLRERCITRDLKWGTPVPLPGFESKVFYVWYDAPIGYVSMTMEYMKKYDSDAWERWWKNPSQVQYYEFMAKDNVPFHSIIFPACQIGTKEPWTKVTHLMATEYLNYEDSKFSKSRGVGVFGDQVKETGICSDVWRFYLLYLRPENQDTVFSWTDLMTKNNSELLNNLGNFVNRSLKFISSSFEAKVPLVTPTKADYRIMAAINQELANYTNCLNNCKIRDGIRSILSISRIGNQFIQDNEPFKLVRADRSEEDKKRGASVIAMSANIVALIGILLNPYMPDASNQILDVLNLTKELSKLPSSFTQFLPTGHKIKEPTPLIRKLTDEEILILKEKFKGQPTPAKPKATSQKTTEENSPIATNIVKDAAKAEQLEKEVTAQGLKVRELKSQGVSKENLAPEIALLLKLKQECAAAQGVDPATLSSSNSKKDKKKKK